MDDAAAIAIRAAERTADALGDQTGAIDRLGRENRNTLDRLADVEGELALTRDACNQMAVALVGLQKMQQELAARHREERAADMRRIAEVEAREAALRGQLTQFVKDAGEQMNAVRRKAGEDRQVADRSLQSAWSAFLEGAKQASGALWAEQLQVRWFNRWFIPTVMVAVSSTFIWTAGRPVPPTVVWMSTLGLGLGVGGTTLFFSVFEKVLDQQEDCRRNGTFEEPRGKRASK